MTYPFGPVVILILRGVATGTDADGNDTFTPAAGVPIRAQYFRAGPGSEALGSQDTVTDQPEVGFYPDTVLTAFDRVSVGGVLYDVDGSPNPTVNPFTGTNFGLVVKLKMVTG